jgi:hypothetical protein
MESYLKNPFAVEGIAMKQYITKEDEQLTVDPETGQYYTIKKVSQNKEVQHDGMVYTKVFQSALLSFKNLSPSGLKVLLYAICNARSCHDVVFLNPPDIMLFYDMSKGTYYNGIDDLLKNKIIAKKLGSSIEFWVNPNVFYNGNRLKLVTSCNEVRHT